MAIARREEVSSPPTTVSPPPKWRSLGERVARLKDGESIVLEGEGDLTAEVRMIYGSRE